MSEVVPHAVLTEMAAYYRARAPEYDEWFYRRGRYDRGLDTNARWFAEVAEVRAEFDRLGITGDVLELAPGTGIWTERIARTARSVTAVDASREMLAMNRARVGNECVAYVLADLFDWHPERTYDATVFAFWLSHVPDERLDSFLRMVAGSLRQDGTVFFVDGLPEPTSTANDHRLPDSGDQTMIRKLNDGRAFQIVKNFYGSRDLERRCHAAGLAVTVHETATYFQYGMGTRIRG